jgi:hypothetical protein
MNVKREEGRFGDPTKFSIDVILSCKTRWFFPPWRVNLGYYLVEGGN